jgi:hypothetical protein
MSAVVTLLRILFFVVNCGWLLGYIVLLRLFRGISLSAESDKGRWACYNIKCNTPKIKVDFMTKIV